jgi:hypothetical protein
VFGRPVSGLLGRATYVLPFVYGFADYAENLSSMAAFGNGGTAGLAAQILPWTTRLKFASLAVCAILVVRFALLRGLRER